MKYTLIALMVLLIATCGCGKKDKPEADNSIAAKAVRQAEITDTLYVDFLAHYKAADNRIRMEGQSQTGKASPQEIQTAHLAKLKVETLKLEKQFGVTRSALDEYMAKKKLAQSDYWVKNIYPKLATRTAELEKTAIR